jgi:hypothetical protein
MEVANHHIGECILGDPDPRLLASMTKLAFFAVFFVTAAWVQPPAGDDRE